MTFLLPFPSPSSPRSASADEPTDPAPSAGADLPQWQKDWEEEERLLAAKYIAAVNRITQQGIEAAVAAALCWGCGHPTHRANACNVVPLFTKERRCGCTEEA